MADDVLYVDWALRGTLEEQIKEAIKDTAKLQEALKKAAEQGLEVDAKKFGDNFKKNVNDAERALYKLMDAKEKAERALSKHASFRDENMYGFDDSKLQSGVKKLDEIINKIMAIGVEATISKTHVKDMLSDMSADIVTKSVVSSTKELNSQIEKEEKAIAKSIKDAAKEAAKAQKDEEDAAANNAKNQQKVQDALAKIATARSNLSKASTQASEQEAMHVKLLLNLLDRLSSKLAAMKGMDLSAKDALTGVLGSGYQGLMRNVMTAIADLTSGKLNISGMSDEEWNAEKLLATRKEITNTFNKEYEAQEKVNKLLRERQEMEEHRKSREQAKDEAEVAAVTAQINRELAERERLNKMLDSNRASYMALDKIKLDTESQQKVAIIRNQTAEYNALQQKLIAIADLMRRVEEEQQQLKDGTKKTPSLTREVITQELDTIQRQYNETLAKGKQALLDEADAEKKNADAKRKTAAAAKEVNRANADMVNSFNRVLDRVTHSNRMLGQLQQQYAGFVGIYGIERLLKNIIQIGGEFEVQHIALQSILGDVQKANSMFEQMKELAVVSPFNFRQLAAYSKQIAAFNIPYDEMYDTTKRLADMAAGLGVDMSRLVLAYGQVRSAAVLRGQELRQFTEAGIPMVQALANEFTKLNGRAVSTAEVFELISKRAVPFEMVKKVMWDMTNEGGRFFDMQFVLSDTLAGKWSNLQDAWEIMLSEFAKGESLSGQFLKSMVTLLTKLTEAANTLMPLLAGGGLFYSMKKVQGMFAGMGLAGIDANIKKAQQLQAIELRRKLINQEITREQYEQAMAMNQSQAKYYVLLANEGKLKNYQIQRLIIQKQINNARLQELVRSGELTTREAAQVRLWRMKNGQVSAFQMRMNNLWEGAKGFMKANWWMLAIDVAITALTTWYAKAEEAKAKNKELTDSFANSAKELHEAYKALDDSKISTDDDYKSGIAGLKEQVKQHSANYDAIMREVNSIETLEGQYKRLKQALADEALVAYQAEEIAEKFGDNTRSAFEKANEYARYMTTGRQGFWDVMFGADTDVDRGLEKNVKKLYEKILQVIPDVGKNEKSNELYRQLRNNIEEQLGFGSKERMLINIKLNELFGIDNIEDATTLVVDKFDEMLSKAAPEIANKIRYDMPLEEAEKEKVAALVNDATEETKKKFPYYANTLQQLLNDSNFVANVQIRFSTDKSKANALQQFIYGNFPLTGVSEDTKNIATNWGTNGSMYAAKNAAKKDIDQAYNELVSRQSTLGKLQKETNKNQEQIDKAQSLVDKANSAYKVLVEAALTGLGYDYEGEKKKSNKEKTPRKGKDEILDVWKARISLLEKYNKELKDLEQYMTKAAAERKLRENGDFNSLWQYFLNPNDYKGSVNQAINAMGPNPQGDRLKFVNDQKAKRSADDMREWTDSVKDAVSELQNMLSVMSENYKTYKKWVDLTGNTDLAAKISGVTQNTSYADYLTKQMTQQLTKTNLALTAEDVFGLSESEAKKLGEKNGIFTVWKEWQENQQKVKKEQWDLYEEAIKSSKSYEDKIADINRKLKEQIELFKKMDISQSEKNKLINQATENAEKDIAKQKWEQFKDESNWGEMFGDLDRLTTETINNMIKNLERVLPSIKSDEQSVRELYNALDKMRKEFSERNPFANIFGSLRQSSRLRQLQNDVISKQGSFTPNAKSAKYYGLKEGHTYTSEEIKNLIKGEDSNFAKGLEGLAASFKAVEDVLDPVVDLFEALGDTSLSEVLNIGGGAIGAASQAAGALNTLGLEKAGPYGAAAAAALNVATSLFALHDKALQKEIEASEARQKEMENLTKNLGMVLERTLGGIYQTEVGSEAIDRLKKEITNEYKGINSFVAKVMGVSNTADYKEYLKNDTIEAVKNAEKTKKYYDAAYASLLAQRDEIQHQMESEEDKKNSDADKLADYRQQIIEMEDQVNHFAQDMARDLWDIDIKSWAQTLTETIVDAWKNGENAVDAYKNKVKEMMLDLTTNILSQKVMEKMLEKTHIDTLIENLMKETKGELDVEAVTQIADRLNMAAEESADTIIAILDKMEARGYISKGDESGSSATTNGIGKAITEQDTSLWSSYLNAIRADVSVNRMTLMQILSTVQAQSEIPVIARAQLQQLQQIAINTGRNADLVQEIRNLLDGNIKGANKFRIQ